MMQPILSMIKSRMNSFHAVRLAFIFNRTAPTCSTAPYPATDFGCLMPLPPVVRCRVSAACPAFLVDYDRGACFRLDLTSEGRTQLLVPARGHTAYFEKVCLQGELANTTV